MQVTELAILGRLVQQLLLCRSGSVDRAGMRFSLSIPTEGLPETELLGDVKLFPVNTYSLDLDEVHGSDDNAGFVRLSKATVTKQPEEEGGEVGAGLLECWAQQRGVQETQVVVSTVHTADWQGEVWGSLCVEEMDFYEAFIVEGIERAPAAQGDSPEAEAEAVDHSRESITEVAAEYAGEAVLNQRLTRRLWAFVTEGHATTQQLLPTLSALVQRRAPKPISRHYGSWT